MNRFRELKQRLIKSKRDSQKLVINLQNQTQLQDWVEKQLQYYGISPSSYRLRQLKNLFQLHQQRQSKQICQGKVKVYQEKQQSKTLEYDKKQSNVNNAQKSNNLQQQMHKQQQSSLMKPSFVKKNTSFSQVQNQHKHAHTSTNQDRTLFMQLNQVQQQQQQQDQQQLNNIDKVQNCIVNETKSYNNINKSQTNIVKNNNNKNDSKQSEQSRQKTQRISSSSLSNQNNTHKNRIICKKTKRQHISSTNDMQQIKASSSSSITQKEPTITNLFSSYQQQHKQPIQKPIKQLDYYTLILQLTAQLNYSRMNKQTKNEKSILKQIKNLISYIQGNSNTSTTGHSSLPITDPNSNNKSCHTFSSIHSNDSLNTIQNHNHNQCHQYSPLQQQKNLLKVKRCVLSSGKQQSININEYNLLSDRCCQYNNRNDQDNEQQSEEEHDQTFKSINQFQDQCSPQSQRNNSIIDVVNYSDGSHSPGRQVILIQQTEDQPNIIIENSPLSKITEHQSQYTNSIQPSLNESPSKLNHNKYPKSKSLLSTENLKQQCNSNYNQLNIPSLQFSQALKNKGDSKDSTNWFHFLPQNQMILKKLSDKLQNTQNCPNSLEQSLQYKRILYMLDSEYASSDLKNRTFSSIFGQTSSLPLNQSGSEKSMSLYYLKNPSDSSAKSFNKQIFESYEQNENKHLHKNKGHCLMNNLDALFKNQSTKNIKSPRLLKFESENEHESAKQSQRMKKHQRSRTSLQCSGQGLNKTRKYRLNLLSQLSYQGNQQSQQNAFDVDKYQKIRTQYEDDSVYHKVSRNSYLTSSSPNSNVVTSSQSQLQSGAVNFIKKGNLIVKKNKQVKNQQNNQYLHQQQQKKSLIVKKNKKSTKHTQNSDSEHTKRLINKQNKQNKQNICFPQLFQNLSSEIRYKDSQCGSFRKQKPYIRDFQILSNNGLESNSNDDPLFIKSMSQIDGQSLKQNSVMVSSSRDNIQQSKMSDTGCRPIKYKVYTKQHKLGEKQDKRKVLKDIVSILNTKYNKNIQLKD